MARIVVVGAGFAGLSAAARLAKLRHDVVVLESSGEVGGRLQRVNIDGHQFALSPETVTLPGVLRDLFRKSGRPLEQAADLTPSGPRRHVFDSVDSLDLPFGQRADQHDAIRSLFDDDQWSPWLDGWPDRWDIIRRNWLDRLPEGKHDLDKAAAKTLQTKLTIGRLVKKSLKDDDLAKLVLDPLKLDGQDDRLVPGFTAVRHYVERTFGRWGFEGGFPTLTAALETRLRERKVSVTLNCPVDGLVMSPNEVSGQQRVIGVAAQDEIVEADIVVWCAPQWPRPLPQPPLTPAIPSTRTFVRVDPSFGADLPHELLVHHKPPIRLWHSGNGCWTIIHQSGDDALLSLAHAGLPFRDHLVDDVKTLSPPDLVRLGHWGWKWMRWTAVDAFPGVGRRTDLYLAGAHAWPSGVLDGGSIEEIGMATAAIAERIGPVPR